MPAPTRDSPSMLQLTRRTPTRERITLQSHSYALPDQAGYLTSSQTTVRNKIDRPYRLVA